jgi:hypothetical protein
MHARGPPRNVRTFPQTPGILPAAWGTELHRIGLENDEISETKDLHRPDILELVGILSPYFFRGIDEGYGNHDSLAFSDSEKQINQIFIRDNQFGKVFT